MSDVWTCALVLYITPVAGYPDHHTLAVVPSGMIEVTLNDDALAALIRAMTVVVSADWHNY